MAHSWYLWALLHRDIFAAMQAEQAEKWRKLCEQAAVEQDPERLLELSQEINRLLEEKEERLRLTRPGHAA